MDIVNLTLYTWTLYTWHVTHGHFTLDILHTGTLHLTSYTWTFDTLYMDTLQSIWYTWSLSIWRFNLDTLYTVYMQSTKYNLKQVIFFFFFAFSLCHLDTLHMDILNLTLYTWTHYISHVTLGQCAFDTLNLTLYMQSTKYNLKQATFNFLHFLCHLDTLNLGTSHITLVTVHMTLYSWTHYSFHFDTLHLDNLMFHNLHWTPDTFHLHTIVGLF